MNYLSSKPITAGFTLIEMLVSLALFTIVVTIAVGSLLVLISGNSRLQGEQSVMTTLAFALDSMSREIRTGSGYYCWNNVSVNTSQPTTGIGSTRDCTSSFASSHWLSFVEGGASLTAGTGNQRVAYYFDSTATPKTIMRQIGNNAAESMIPQSSTGLDGIEITDVQFFVSGSAVADTNQPTVTIVIEATESTAAGDKLFTLQTTVTQRELDL
jgi:prepilin-type N-terminal cleavage/methylation domain-containing protein